jgi:hypothetical protein
VDVVKKALGTFEIMHLRSISGLRPSNCAGSYNIVASYEFIGTYGMKLFFTSASVILVTVLLDCCNGRESSSPLTPFRHLRQPYEPCTFAQDTTARPAVWLNIFRRDTASFENRAARIDVGSARRFARAFANILDELERQGM